MMWRPPSAYAVFYRTSMVGPGPRRIDVGAVRRRIDTARRHKTAQRLRRLPPDFWYTPPDWHRAVSGRDYRYYRRRIIVDTAWYQSGGVPENGIGAGWSCDTAPGAARRIDAPPGRAAFSQRGRCCDGRRGRARHCVSRHFKGRVSIGRAGEKRSAVCLALTTSTSIIDGSPAHGLGAPGTLCPCGSRRWAGGDATRLAGPNGEGGSASRSTLSARGGGARLWWLTPALRLQCRTAYYSYFVGPGGEAAASCQFLACCGAGHGQ
jgi:hypothetical protein